jgi:hypothetical protein
MRVLMMAVLLFTAMPVAAQLGLTQRRVTGVKRDDSRSEYARLPLDSEQQRAVHSPVVVILLKKILFS